MIITYGYFNIILWDGTKTILLRMKRRFQIYTSFVENVKDSYKKRPESVLKCLSKYHFYILTNNRLWRAKTLEYKIDSKIFVLLT